MTHFMITDEYDAGITVDTHTHYRSKRVNDCIKVVSGVTGLACQSRRWTKQVLVLTQSDQQD